MKLLVRAAACVLVAGCTTYKPPPPPTPRDASLVTASMGQTWDAVIDLFATRNIPIRTIERASGLIVTDALRVGQEGNTYASCGTVNGKVLAPDRATYNVLVRGDSSMATVRTTVLWTRTAEPIVPECTSTFIWERAWRPTSRRARSGRAARWPGRRSGSGPCRRASLRRRRRRLPHPAVPRPSARPSSSWTISASAGRWPTPSGSE